MTTGWQMPARTNRQTSQPGTRGWLSRSRAGSIRESGPGSARGRGPERQRERPAQCHGGNSDGGGINHFSACDGANSRAKGERRSNPERSAQRSSSRASSSGSGSSGRPKKQTRSHPQRNYPLPATMQSGRGLPTARPAGRFLPRASCSALSIPAKPGRRFRWRATSFSARWRRTIPISGWEAQPVHSTIRPMPANTGFASILQRMASP